MRKEARPQKSVVIPWWVVIGVAVLLLGVLPAVAWRLGGPVAAVAVLTVVLLPTVGARVLWQALGCGSACPAPGWCGSSLSSLC
jgi:hypothetical protein